MDQPSSHLKIKRAGSVAVVEFADRKILEELSIQEIGDEQWVRADVARLLQDGNGAMRQRQAWRCRGEVSDVIAEAAAATVRGLDA
ncbi:MAG TPA: hypothetical protein PLP66_11250 [Phycisphaerae bacterium]|nr:hypothetical protein [Phycisphaerae bacterium]